MSSAFRRTPSMHYPLLPLLLLLLSLTPTIVDSQTRTMCLTQLSLSSQACSLLPISRRRHDFGLVKLLRDHNGHHDHDHHHHHHHHHEEEEEEEGRGRRESGHHHRHHHHHHGEVAGDGGKRNDRNRRHGTWVEEECCRWLRELDSLCVCRVMTRLPRFLLRPHHNLTLSVGGVCNVTYSCASGF